MPRNMERNQITEGVIWKQLLSYFFPILLGTFFQQMYNTADTIIVGRFVGTQALAAVGSTAALISLINGFFVGLSSGATVLISQFYGASDRRGVSRAIHTGIGLSLVLGVLVTVLGLTLGQKSCTFPMCRKAALPMRLCIRSSIFPALLPPWFITWARESSGPWVTPGGLRCFWSLPAF